MSSRAPRTRKQPVKKKPVSPSLTSLFSSLTQSSSGSNSTVTQESMLWGKHSSSKQGAVKRSAAQHKKSKKEPLRKSIEEEPRPNVFAFMESDGEGEDVVGDLPSDSDGGFLPINGTTGMAPQYSIPFAPSPPVSSSLPAVSEAYEQSISARPLSFTSLHSDSGISIRSSSPDRPSPIMTQKVPKRSVVERVSTRSKPRARGNSNSSAASSVGPGQVRYQWEGAPESFYAQAVKTAAPPPQKAKPSPNMVSVRKDSSKKLRRAKVSGPGEPIWPDKGGYDFLASNISADVEEAPKPLYRRFETLNNRILLVLQDEITTMENDLAVMDQRIAETERAAPSSRRAELRAPTPLQWQRMQLCGMLIPKLSHYNRALASYNALAHLAPTSEDEVQGYRDFLAEHNPISTSETAFLDHLADLSTITNKAGDASTTDGATLNAAAAVLVTVVVFKLVSNLIARMVIGGVMLLAMVSTGLLPADSQAESAESEEGEEQVWGQRTALYGVAVFVLALAVG